MLDHLIHGWGSRPSLTDRSKGRPGRCGSRHRGSLAILESLEARTLLTTAALTGTTGNEITAVAGSSTGTTLLGTFVDSDQSETASDFTSGGGSVVVNWGDGSAPQTLAAFELVANGTADGVTWNIDAAHTYTQQGTYAYTIAVTDADGAYAAVSGSAVVADAPLTAGSSTFLTANSGVALPSTTVVATFNDGNSFSTTDDYTASIDWGDGSPESTGVIVATATPGVFDIEGGHNYATPGAYDVTATVLDDGGSTVVITGSATVTDLPVTGATTSFTAVEGQNTGSFVLATFEDPNTLATVSDVTADLAIGGWGDGTPSGAGVSLAVQQTGVDPTNGDPIFEVLGSHTYAEVTPPGLPDTLSVIITTLGGVTTTLTSPPGGGVTVLDAPLTGSAGTAITGVAGNSTGSVLLGTFADADQVATVADYTSGGGSVVVDWGDGSAPQTLSASNLTAIGTPNGVSWNIDAAHTYTAQGTYAYTVTVTDDGGATTVISGSAVIADGALTAGQAVLLTPNSGIALPGTTVVATFNDTNSFATTADDTASIDWGDGSPNSTGTVVATATPGVFDVEGGHSYAEAGVYDVTATVLGDGGSTVVITGSATVTDLPVSGATKSFTAVEGQNTGSFVLATFEDPNTLATVSDVTATLAIGGWGDGTPDVSGVSLVVQQTGVDPTNGDPIFEVLGSHTYAEATPPGLPDTLSVIITTLGGVTTTLTSPPGGGVTVLGAPLTGSAGTAITGVAGNSTGSVLLGTFADADQSATIADYTSGGGSAVVNWGDGSAPQTLTSANLTAIGIPDGVTWTIDAAHTYAAQGTYDYTVTVTDSGGSATIVAGSAVIGDAALTPSATQPTITASASTPPSFSGAVASFTDANPTSTTADFTAEIDWGDGTPPTFGAISQPGGIGTAYVVSGAHSYAGSELPAGSSHYAIQVFVVETGGARLTVDNTATVPIALTGQLAPNDTSALATDTTNVNQPDFLGTSAPSAAVTLYATLLPGGSPVQIGQVTAASDGSWNIKSGVVLSDGHYEITGTAVAPPGGVNTSAVIASDLVVDTTGPVIASVVVNAGIGQVDYVIKDPVPASGGAPSGVWFNSLLDTSNYLLTKVHANTAHPGKWVVTNVTETPDATIPYAYDVAVTFNAGAKIKPGSYLFTIRGSSNGSSSVQDLAENHLDGIFNGSFPSGNGVNGSDFVAQIQAHQGTVHAASKVKSQTASGELRVAASHARPKALVAGRNHPRGPRNR